jgi:hypothetical protein
MIAGPLVSSEGHIGFESEVELKASSWFPRDAKKSECMFKRCDTLKNEMEMDDNYL